ncbi:hypothetical protein LTR08_000692 [Meristemomyces frigidus]|nr:hypothetical protein LTR08_000692 [Meristemomyces frigidus]
MSRASPPALPLYHAPPKRTTSPPPTSSLQPPSDAPSRGHQRAKSRVRLPGQQSITSAHAQLSTEQIADKHATSLSHGLHPSDASTRLHVQGPNELPHEEPEPMWLRFVKQFQETLILLLLASAAISAFMGNYEDAVSIAVAVTIVVTVAFVQEYRSEKSLEALAQLVPHSAHVIRSLAASQRAGAQDNGVPKDPGHSGLAAAEKASTTISATQLVTGDLVLFHTGDRIPADIRVTHAADLSIDESSLTGENEPVHKSTDTLSAAEMMNGSTHSPMYGAGMGGELRLSDQTNIAFMGTLVRSGYGQGIVVGTGGETEFGAISASLQEIESPRTPLQLSMDRLGKDLSYMSFAVIGLIMLVGLWRGLQFLELFQIGVSLAVAAIPEGLPIIVTVTLALGVLRMSKRNAIVRRLPSVETLGSVNVICSDKTGTLTINHMTATKLWSFGDGAPKEVAKVHADAPNGATTQAILRTSNVVNNARLNTHKHGHVTAASAAVLASTGGDDLAGAKSRWAGQPTDVALLDLLDAFGEDDVRERIGKRKHEVPFSSERKWMGISVEGQGVDDTAYIKGALERVLSRCDTYLTSTGGEVVLDDKRRQEAEQAAQAMAEEGLRVLSFASGPVKPNDTSFRSRSGVSTPVQGPDGTRASESIYHGLCFAGLVGMSDPPRKGVDRSIRRLMAGGVKVIMITGDAETTAIAIGKKLGMPINMSSALGSPVLRGDQLDHMSDEELTQAMSRVSIFARTSPDHKLKIIRALQARGDVVAMTGDGVNDAPALKKADIGISMGKLGTDVAKEAADMILTDDDFSTILSAIEEGKGIFYNIQNFLTFQLSTSVAALGLVMMSTLGGWRNPLNAMQILWINILMDGPPAQSLGVEPVDPALLQQPPRPRNARVLTPGLIRRVLQSALVILFGTLFTYVSNLTPEDLAAHSVSDRDTTLTFTQFVLFDMFNALTCRSASKSVLKGELPLYGKGGNKMFNYAVAGSLAGQAMVIYFPPLQRVFQTEALGLGDLMGLVVMASSVLWVDEGRKWWDRRRRGGAGLGGYSRRV